MCKACPAVSSILQWHPVYIMQFSTGEFLFIYVELMPNFHPHISVTSADVTQFPTRSSCTFMRNVCPVFNSIIQPHPVDATWFPAANGQVLMSVRYGTVALRCEGTSTAAIEWRMDAMTNIRMLTPLAAAVCGYEYSEQKSPSLLVRWRMGPPVRGLNIVFVFGILWKLTALLHSLYTV
jgi:hypothetical protein